MNTRDIIATDAQLIMLLTTLVEMEEKDRAMKMRSMAAGKKQKQQIKSPEEETDNEEDMFVKGLFLPEFVQVRGKNEKIFSYHDILTFWFVLPFGLSFFMIPFQTGLQTHYWGNAITSNLSQSAH